MKHPSHATKARCFNLGRVGVGPSALLSRVYEVPGAEDAGCRKIQRLGGLSTPSRSILGRIRRPSGRWNMLAAARVREVRRIDAQRTQVACLRAAVTFDSGGGSASSAENCECTTDETLVVSCGSHLLARFRFLFDEQKMGFGRSYCNAQSDRPAMQRKQARSVFKPAGPADRPWEEALCRSGPKGFPDPIVIGA